MIKVGPHSKTGASLVITELQMERAFCVTTFLKGMNQDSEYSLLNLIKNNPFTIYRSPHYNSKS